MIVNFLTVLLIGNFATLTSCLLAPTVVRSVVERVTPSPTPILYVYDHCSYCVRVRLAFGLKNIRHELRFLANDDLKTPTDLVGKKIVPIFQRGPGGISMPESLDIIEVIDSDPQFGKIRLFKPLSGRTDVKEWQAKVKDINSMCQRPRYMMVPLPEFHQRDSRETFVLNHPLPSFGKKKWQENLSSEQRWQEYASSYAQSLGSLNDLNSALTELDGLVYSEDFCTEGGLSLDDIDLWSRYSLHLQNGRLPVTISSFIL